MVHRHDPFDFLTNGRVEQHRRFRRKATRAGVAAAALLVIVGLGVGLPAWRTYGQAKGVERHLREAQRALAGQRFNDAKRALDQATKALDRTRAAYRPLRAWSWLPGLGSNVQTGTVLLDVVGIAIRAGGRVADFGQELLSPLEADRRDFSYASLSVQERVNLFQRLGQAEPTLAAISSDIQEINTQLRLMPRSWLKRRVDRQLRPLSDNLGLLEAALQRAAPIARVLPKLLGYGKTQTYLFLLQNNTELRPTGGFIGTYGIIKVRDGEILSFTTDNSYNLDNRVKGKLRIPAPLALQKYNSTEHWFFRDANWSPDFRESAAKTISFYQQEGGREQLQGVWAVTPTFIEGLLGLTGPVTVNGITFTAENFVDTLQEQVTFGFARQGIPESERKEVIGTMGQQLIAKIFSLPQRRWGELWSVMLANLSEKHVLFNFQDPELQLFAEAQDWAGAVATTEGDYLLLVDANLASLKTDPKVKRTIEYSLDANGSQAQTTVKVTYANEGSFTKKTTRYRTYLRLYVPQGATLVSSEGADLRDRSTSAGQVTTDEEMSKTVFGAFKSIEPGTTESISFTYRLPQRINDQIAGKSYSLSIQKQPGTIAHALKLRLELPRPARIISGIDNPPPNAHTPVSFETDLRRDRQLQLTFGR